MTAQTTNNRGRWIRTGIALAVIIVAASGLIYWQVTSARVYVDAATIEAPLIQLTASQPGVLQTIAVNPGDTVAQNAVVAQVGNELLKSKVAGLVVSTSGTIGAQMGADQAVVTMIDPTALRVVGKVDEDKGLSRIHVGDQVVFTVDAFGGKQYQGVVDEVSPTSEATQIVFNISDQRQVQQFDVKVRFDAGAYPELKNGMSARMWVYGG